MNGESRELSVVNTRGLIEQFQTAGFVFVRSFLTPGEIAQLRDSITPLLDPRRAGARNILQRSAIVAELAKSERLVALLAKLTGAVPFAVRGLLFEKTKARNWQVTWHQDLMIAVKARTKVSGFGSWSVKDGVNHTEAPTHLLERILTVRIHLDDADENNGALRVISGSHRLGKLDQRGIERTAEGSSTTCSARAGDALVMRPLLLHASSPAANPSHRRVIHIEYAVDDLPSPLEWFERVA